MMISPIGFILFFSLFLFLIHVKSHSNLVTSNKDKSNLETVPDTIIKKLKCTIILNNKLKLLWEIVLRCFFLVIFILYVSREGCQLKNVTKDHKSTKINIL